jgi:hypothetical protein
MDWPVGNRFHRTDMQLVLNFRMKVLEERYELDFESGLGYYLNPTNHPFPQKIS